MIAFLRKRFSLLDVHTKEVAKKSFSSTIVKVIGMIATLILSIALGRTIGAEGIGIINIANRVVTLVIVFCLLGMPNVLIKHIAIANSKNDWRHIGDTMYTAYWLNGGVSILITIILILLSPYISNHFFHEPKLTFPLIIAFVVLPSMVFSRIFASGFIGYKKIWQSNLVDRTLSAWVTVSLLFVFWLFDFKINVNVVAVIYAVGRLVVTFTTWAYWKKLFPHKQKRSLISKELLKTSLPLLLVSATAVLSSSTATLILGWLSDTKEVGLFSVAARLAMLTVFFLQVTNSAVSPKLAAMYSEGKIVEMEKMVQKVTMGLIIIGFFSLIVFTVFGKFILSLWGHEFVNSYWLLVILAAGQFVNISTGAGGLLLIMCGFEKTQSRISVTFVIINILLSLTLIYFYSALGAAIAMALTVSGENISRVIMAKKKTGVLTIPLGRTVKADE